MFYRMLYEQLASIVDSCALLSVPAVLGAFFMLHWFCSSPDMGMRLQF